MGWIEVVGSTEMLCSTYSKSLLPLADNMLIPSGGTMPWADRDLMQWPVATAGSNAMDLVVQRIVPRSTLMSQFTAAENGELFWQDSVHYYKGESSFKPFPAEAREKRGGRG